MAEVYTTLGQSTLASSYTGGSGSMVVASASSFPSTNTFSITDGSGNVWTVTNVSGTTFSVTSEFGTDVSLSSGQLMVEVLTARALTALLASLLVTMTQTVVTGSRALGSVYHNTTTRPMFVKAVSYNTSNGSVVTAYSDSSSSPSTIVDLGNQAADTYMAVDFWVLPGNYYEVSSSMSGSAVLQDWVEWAITNP